MTKVDDGGPAFASLERGHDGSLTAFQGMTLRDWFAGQTLAGIWADATLKGTAEQIAKAAYDQADAMLAARAKAGDA